MKSGTPGDGLPVTRAAGCPDCPIRATFDAFSGRGAATNRELKFGRMLESLIEHDGWPSFLKLLAIADFFDVSLDYLVYGQPDSSVLPDCGPLYRYIDHALADVQARGSRHTAVMARIGRVLADRIDVAAKELAATPAAAREGLIQDDELLRLERYCAQCDLVSLQPGFPRSIPGQGVNRK